MNRQQPLDTLIDLAREARDNAGQALATDRRSRQQVEVQIETLGRYRLEYAQRLQQAMFDGIDPATMHNYQAFLRSLDAALERARRALDEQQQRVQASQQHWQQQQRKLSSYDTLATRRAEQASRRESRREMRHSDEITNNTLLRQRNHDAASPSGA
ncbi:hypothetical protein GCM10007160_01660 [Litchfieldella qijiaojingensis]|uniref:Flagellar FliJ protein n=1 Tax=Litchfieldella qijiaojingensis TaxID=980347 RepID=A0ABQ2YBE0_9GAMM|nr:flagellar export protein FliJ [Halomonas qijiaojingensis]GGX78098.1 hypothetical protein GCM10007160_01660 [Halomonas qijiaojingensis]